MDEIIASTCALVQQCNDLTHTTHYEEDSILLLEKRSFRPFKSSEEYLFAMKEDLAEWLNALYELQIDVDNFFEKLESGVVLCKHANNVRNSAEEQKLEKIATMKALMQTHLEIPPYDVYFRSDAAAGSFFARDNVHNFIRWCRDLGVHDVLMFETDDLVLRKNEKHVILALLEIARRGARFGMQAPVLVQMEVDIDKELEADRLAEERRLRLDRHDMLTCWEESQQIVQQEPPPLLVYGPQLQIINNDLKSLDEMVRELVERCTCPSQFPMVKVSEGKYRIGDTKVLIFVRILRNHVMVRVGGGWDTLHHYLDKHDPCRCRSGHRFSNLTKVAYKSSRDGDRQLSSVTYDRPDDGSYPSSPMNRRKNGCWRKDSVERQSARLRSNSPAKAKIPPSNKENHKMDGPENVVPSSPEVWCDSSSEVSDEGYKSQGPPRSSARSKKPQKKYDIEEILERPDSSMTQLSSEGSCVSGEDNGSTLNTIRSPAANKIESSSLLSPNIPRSPAENGQKTKFSLIDNINSRFLLSKKTKKNSTPDNRPAWNSGPGKIDSNARTRRSSSTEPMEARSISRSQSATSEGGLQTMFNRDVHNRQSYRSSPKKSLDSSCSGKKTWNGRNKTYDYSGLAVDTFRSPLSHRSIRSASASPAASRRRFPTSGPPTPMNRSPKRSAPASVLPSPVSTIPHELFNQLPDVGSEGDVKILEQLEHLLNSYRVRVANRLAAEGRTLPPELEAEPGLSALNTPERIKPASLKITPRKSGIGSRIPAPKYFNPPQTEI